MHFVGSVVIRNVVKEVLMLKDKYDTWVYKHSLSELEQLYRKDLQINRHRLEYASLEQATKFERWYSALEDVEGDVADLKLQLGRARAKVDIRTRNISTKLNESGIKSRIALDKDVNGVEKEIRLISRYASKLKGAVEAARQRKSMIVVLKDLYISNYWDKTTECGTPVHGRRSQRQTR